MLFAIPPFVLPTPGLVLTTLIADGGLLWNSLLVTLLTTFEGFRARGCRWCRPRGPLQPVAIGRILVLSFAVILQVTPVVAIAPLLLIYLPQPLAVLVCAWIVAFFPVLANTTLGLNSIDHNLLALFDLYKASRWQVLWNLKLPSALPQTLAGLRIAGGLSLIGAVVAEIAAGSAGAGSGLAYRIAESGYRLNIPRMFAALLLLSLAGVAIFLCAVGDLVSGAASVARERSQARTLVQNVLHDHAKACHHNDHLDQAAMQPEREHGGNRGKRRRAEIERQRIKSVPAHRASVHFSQFAEQHVQREPHRQIEDDADDGGGNGGERAGQLAIGAQPFDEWRTCENPEH